MEGEERELAQLEEIAEADLDEVQRKRRRVLRRKRTLQKKKGGKKVPKNKKKVATPPMSVDSGSEQSAEPESDQRLAKTPRRDSESINARNATANNSNTGNPGQSNLSGNSQNSDLEIERLVITNAMNRDNNRSRRDSNNDTNNTFNNRNLHDLIRTSETATRPDANQRVPLIPPALPNYRDNRALAELMTTARKTLDKFDGDCKSTNSWILWFDNMSSQLPETHKRLLFFERLGPAIRNAFVNNFPILEAHPVTTYLQWLKSNYYTPDGLLQAHERLAELQWDYSRQKITEFLTEFQNRCCRELDLSESAKKVALFNKMPLNVQYTLRLKGFDDMTFHQVTAFLSNNDLVKDSLKLFNSVASIQPTPPVDLEAHDVNAVDHTNQHRRDRPHKPRKFDNNNSYQRGPPRCNKCHKIGHIARKCLAHVQCYYCHRNGHRAADCRRKAADEKYNGDKRPRHDDSRDRPSRHNDDPREKDERSSGRKTSSK
jgi:hypothetical protein